VTRQLSGCAMSLTFTRTTTRCRCLAHAVITAFGWCTVFGGHRHHSFGGLLQSRTVFLSETHPTSVLLLADGIIKYLLKRWHIVSRVSFALSKNDLLTMMNLSPMASCGSFALQGPGTCLPYLLWIMALYVFLERLSKLLWIVEG